MRAGRHVIYQGALAHGDFEGYPDFLYKVPSPSSLGGYGYEIADTKLAKHPKPYFLLQLSSYAKMLEAIQGRRPERVYIVNGAGERLAFRTDDYFFYFAALEKEFLEAQRRFDPESPPLPDARADHGRWQSHADRILEERDHPCRVAGITLHQTKRLGEAGITTLTELATTSLTHVPKMDDAVFERLRAQARLQRASRGQAVPLYEIVTPASEIQRIGLALLPPFSPMDVYFDMEGYPLVDGGLEYLFGASHVEGGAPAFKDFWAHDRAGEKRAFEAFIDWVYARFRADPSMHVFHYASYEVAALRRLMGAHGTREEELDALLTAEVFVDLYRVVKQAVRIGESSYSLKKVEHLYRRARTGEVATASESVVEYARWLEHRDGDAWETSPTLAGIRAYNREDCESTWELRTWLARRQAEQGIAYVSPVKKNRKGLGEEKKLNRAREASEALARRLLESVPQSLLDRGGDVERWRLQELLGHLVEFHRRESKPIWWAMYDRQAKTHQELVEDGDCLGACTRTAAPRVAVKQSFVYEYRFDPNQDTKLSLGSQCKIAEDLSDTEIATFDADAGLLHVKLGKKREEPPAVMSLIPDEFVDAEAIAASIARTAEAWERRGMIDPALDTLLRRAPPRVRGVEAGAPLLGGALPSEVSVTDLISRLDRSTLAIQGPPGAGKTRLAAAAIAALASKGSRIGITSNSHAAIQKLIEEVQKRSGHASRHEDQPRRRGRAHPARGREGGEEHPGGRLYGCRRSRDRRRDRLGVQRSRVRRVSSTTSSSTKPVRSRSRTS